MNSFTDLIVWQEGHKLVLKIYQNTKVFPSEERFGLTSQIRQAAVSITSNIAEGYSRQSFKEKLQFYCIALGSLTEMQNQLLISRDIEYLEGSAFSDISLQSVRVSKLLNGIKSTKLKCSP